MIPEHHLHPDATSKALHNWILEQNYELLFTQYLKLGNSKEPPTDIEKTRLAPP